MSKVRQTNKKIIADNILYHNAVVAGWSVLPRRLTKIVIIAPKKGDKIPKIIPKLTQPFSKGSKIIVTPMKPNKAKNLLDHPTNSLIKIGANNTTNNGMVWSNVVIRLKSMNCNAAKRQPNEPIPVKVLTNNPNLELILKALYFLCLIAVTNNNGIQKKYLKKRTISTDRSPAINLTKLAIMIVQTTSNNESEIPIGILEVELIEDI